LTRAQYLLGVQTQNEDFVYDKLGNRTTLKHNGTDVARYQHNDVNEYTYIGLGSGTNVTHDNAGNMTGDHDGYTYHYDYENRLTRVKKSSDTVDVAVYTYDAIGRRIAVEDCIADTTTHYYYDGWRVLTETDENDDRQRDFAYGNYIDEVLVMTDASDDHYFAHDHLFSVVALIDEDGDIFEQYEYDAYGKCHFYDSSFTLLGTQKSAHANTRLFTSQVLDILDGGALSLEYFKNRYKKDGRFTTRDPLGVRDGICIIEFTPTGAPIFPRANNAKKQYSDGMSLYEYVKSQPVVHIDPQGLYNYYARQAAIPSKRCGVCGPDVTSHLALLAKKVKDFYDDIPDPAMQMAFCNSNFHEQGWDIHQFKPSLYDEEWAKDLGIPIFPTKAWSCQTGDCKETVRVAGRCQSQHEVNYFLWGVMERLCKEHRTDEQRDVVWGYTWKYTFKVGNAHKCKMAWIKAGFDNNVYGVTCGNLDFCQDCGTPWTTLTAHWRTPWKYKGDPLFWPFESTPKTSN